jgi:hypothetical protein
MRTVKWFTGGNHLSEEYQPSGYHFSFAHFDKDQNLVQCHPWVKCKDFLHDAVRTQLSNISTYIYNFKFENGENPPIDLTKTVMLVANSNGAADTDTELKNSLSLLEYFEKVAKVKRSRMEEVSTSGQKKFKRVFLLVSSKMWLTSPILVSMYSFLIRLGATSGFSVTKECTRTEIEKQLASLQTNNKLPNECQKDIKYLNSVWDKLYKTIQHRKTLFDKKGSFHNLYFKEISIYEFHDKSGIVSLCKLITPDNELNIKAKELLND